MKKQKNTKKLRRSKDLLTSWLTGLHRKPLQSLCLVVLKFAHHFMLFPPPFERYRAGRAGLGRVTWYGTMLSWAVPQRFASFPAFR